MLGNQRFHRQTARKPLFFRNPFRSIGVVQRANKVMVGPMIREGITSLENEEKARMQRRLSQLSNAGMLKQMRQLGIIPDDMGVDMSQHVSDIAVLPSGVGNLEDIQKAEAIDRQVDRYNAGILDEQQREQKALLELAQKKKKSEYRTKMIQWLAETDQLDEVPIEFQEEVENYYTAHPSVKRDEILKSRKDKKEKREKKEFEQRKKRTYWAPNNAFSLLEPLTSESVRYTTNTGLLNTNPSPSSVPTMPDPFVIQQVPTQGSGWRAPRLHKLIRPLKRFELDNGPDKIIEDQQQALDDRRAMYREQQTFQRGMTPPKDMVERAMPKLAIPYFAGNPKLHIMGIIA